MAIYRGDGFPQQGTATDSVEDLTVTDELTVVGDSSLRDITLSRGDNTGAVYFGDGSHYLYFDGTNFHLNGSPVPVLALYNNLNFTSGSGINFSATSDGSGVVASEVLDDYEEGTWTPTFHGATTDPTQSYAGQRGVYTKVGNLVTVSCILQMAASGVTAGSGQAQLGGLPYTSYSVDWQNASVGYTQSWGSTVGAPTHALVVANSTRLNLYTYDNDAGNVSGVAGASAADIGNSAYIFIGASYRI